jgi:hypothetical protein
MGGRPQHFVVGFLGDMLVLNLISQVKSDGGFFG